MSHRSSCPTRWEAERQGERAFENGSGRYSNPYGRPFEDRCREAERAWEDGRRSAEMRADEERATEAAAQRRRRAAEEETVRYHEEQAQREYDEAMEAAYYDQMALEEWEQHVAVLEDAEMLPRWADDGGREP